MNGWERFEVLAGWWHGRDTDYSQSDPTGVSDTITAENGEFIGRLLYDGFGAVLTNTMPVSRTNILPNLPDAASGLVHLGDGRWYDPAWGRPLQPNTDTNFPTIPQALNRFTAVPGGQPGVSNQQSFAQYLLATTIGETMEGILGVGLILPVEQYANRVVGKLTISANSRLIGRAGDSDVFTRVKSFGRGRSAIYESEIVQQLSDRKYRVNAGDHVIDLARLEAEGSKRWPLSYPNGAAFSALNDNAIKRWLRNEIAAEFATGLVVELVFALPELVGPWDNPYFTPEQRLVQNVVTVGGIFTSAGAGAVVGAAIGGPLGFVVGVGVGVGVSAIMDYWIKPGVSLILTSRGFTDPYQQQRRLAILSGN
jgi:hypothetical protein